MKKNILSEHAAIAIIQANASLYAGHEKLAGELAIGDDAAILNQDSLMQTIATVDQLVEGTHFLPGAAPSDLGHKCLAVSLSDCAAMGALPRAALLTITAPELYEPWLQEFCSGFFQLAAEFKLSLIGGNVAKGPLAFGVTVLADVEKGQALLQSTAQASHPVASGEDEYCGDDVYVIGCLGAAALGCQQALAQGAFENNPIDNPINNSRDKQCADAWLRPAPLCNESRYLQSFITAAIDISDGLGQDLSRLCVASNCGARIDLSTLPGPDCIKDWPELDRWALQVSGGEDYALCVTANPDDRNNMQAVAAKFGFDLHRIGKIASPSGVVYYNSSTNNSKEIVLQDRSWQHFK